MGLQSPANAAVDPRAEGDIFIGFRATGGQGASLSYLVNIGNDLTFRNATSGAVISLANIGADLTSTYGADWSTRGDLQWGIFGSRNSANPTVYGSKRQSPFGSSSGSYSVLNLTARSGTNSQIISVLDAYGILDATANNSKAVLQTNSSTASSYAAQVGTAGTSDFGSLSGWSSIEDSFSAGAAGTALDLYRFAFVSGSDVVARLGSFSITSDGAVSFLAGPPLNQVQVAASSVTVQEDAGSATITFQRLGDGNSSAVDATFALNNGSAIAGVDFTTPASLTVSFAANQTTKTVPVQITNRTGFHGPRSFSVSLVSATGGYVIGSAASATVTITEADPDPGALEFTGATFAASTADNSVDVTLTRTGGTGGAVAVNVSVTGGTLVNGTDFTYTSPTTVNFADGATTATTTVSLSTLAPGTIILGLGNPTNFSRIGTQGTATINVTGNPGELALGASRYSFFESAGVVNIPIKRSNGVQGDVTVTVNTANGTASAPSDYQAVTNFTATLPDGVSSLNIPVTLVAGTDPKETNETFTITISNPGNGATLGAITTATVRIVKFDTKAPTLTLTSPAANARLTTSTVSVGGTVGDDKGVDHVELSLNGGAVITVTPTGNTTGTFVRTITPVPGLNTLTAVSVDAAGNVSNAVTRTFTYVVGSPLTVNLTPAGSGTLPAPFPGTDANREIGKSYTIKATPKAGFVFAGWTGAGITGTPAAELPSLTFVHKANLVLTANFVAQPYKPEVVGEFSGLIHALAGAPTLSTSGFVDITVTATGSFTGTVKIDGVSLPITGTLFSATGATGEARFGTTRTPQLVIARNGLPGLVLAFSVDLATAGTHQITGTLGEQVRGSATPAPRASFVADRATYGATNLAPVAVQGLHTVALLALPQTNGLTVSDYPQGDGFGSITVSTKGVATFTGTLADGVAVTATAPLTKTGATLHKLSLFSQPYSGKGSLSTVAQFDSTQPDTVLTASDVLWFRPYVPGQYYPFGWLEGVTAKLVGAKYKPAPVAASVVPDLPAVNPVEGNATLVFSAGGLASDLSKNVNISTANAVTKVPAINPTFELKITPVSGDISGTFTHSDGTKPPFKGKIVQKGPDAGTYGYFLTKAPTVVDGAGESGRVSLNHK